MRNPTKQRQPACTSPGIADQFTLEPVLTPAMPSQRESMLGALRLLAGIAVRMGEADHPLPPRDLTCLPTGAMNALPLVDMEGSNE